MFRFTIRDMLWLTVVVALLTTCPINAQVTESITGTWKCETAIEGGKPIDDPVGEYLILTDRTGEERDRDGKLRFTAKVIIDRESTPWHIDLQFKDGTLHKGVFALRGDTLEICWGGM